VEKLGRGSRRAEEGRGGVLHGEQGGGGGHGMRWRLWRAGRSSAWLKEKQSRCGARRGSLECKELQRDGGGWPEIRARRRGPSITAKGTPAADSSV
jgi:hypothetical protein